MNEQLVLDAQEVFGVKVKPRKQTMDEMREMLQKIDRKAWITAHMKWHPEYASVKLSNKPNVTTMEDETLNPGVEAPTEGTEVAATGETPAPTEGTPTEETAEPVA